MREVRLIDPFIPDENLECILRKSPRSLRRYRAKGILPRRKIGGVVGCFESDLRRAFGLESASIADEQHVDTADPSHEADTAPMPEKPRI